MPRTISLIQPTLMFYGAVASPNKIYIIIHEPLLRIDPIMKILEAKAPSLRSKELDTVESTVDYTEPLILISGSEAQDNLQ